MFLKNIFFVWWGTALQIRWRDSDTVEREAERPNLKMDK